MADQGEWSFNSPNLSDFSHNLGVQNDGEKTLLSDIDGKIVLVLLLAF